MTTEYPEPMRRRLVRYNELVGCQEAFLDRRIDGRAGNENFTIIGPGVAESPDQHVHISIPHGFNIGGARQLPHAINSQHSHETAEVFVIQDGRWAFRTGVDGRDAEVVLGAGDVISIPTRVFRGFENVGDQKAYLFAVLGGDDPGRVTWAPDVFEKALDTGLVLLDNGALIDTRRGERIPDGARPMAPTSDEQVSAMRTVTDRELESCVQRASQLEFTGQSALTQGSGVLEAAVIGAASAAESLPAGRMNWPHGFSLRVLRFPPSARIATHRRVEEEVLFVQHGSVRVEWPDGDFTLNPGDVFTTPKHLARRFINPGAGQAEVYVVRGTDQPAPPEFSGQ